VNARSAPQTNNEVCPTGVSQEQGERHWTELSQEELEAKYPDYPSKTVKDIALLNRKLGHIIDDMVVLDRRVEVISAAVEALQTFAENSKKKSDST
jgi:hypothetical protein